MAVAERNMMRSRGLNVLLFCVAVSLPGCERNLRTTCHDVKLVLAVDDNGKIVDSTYAAPLDRSECRFADSHYDLFQPDVANQWLWKPYVRSRAPTDGTRDCSASTGPSLSLTEPSYGPEPGLQYNIDDQFVAPGIGTFEYVYYLCVDDVSEAIPGEPATLEIEFVPVSEFHQPVEITLLDAADSSATWIADEASHEYDCAGLSCTFEVPRGVTVALQGASEDAHPAWVCDGLMPGRSNYWRFAALQKTTCRLSKEVELAVSVPRGVPAANVQATSPANTMRSASREDCSETSCDCATAPCLVIAGTELELEASDSEGLGFKFAGWAGCSGVQDKSLTLTPMNDTTCEANFDVTQVELHTLDVQLDTMSAELATITDDGELDCPGVCSTQAGGSVTLRVVPRNVDGAALDIVWGEACAGATGPEATVSMDSDKVCTVTITEAGVTCDGFVPTSNPTLVARNMSGQSLTVDDLSGTISISGVRANAQVQLDASSLAVGDVAAASYSWQVDGSSLPDSSIVTWMAPPFGGSALTGSLIFEDGCSPTPTTIDFVIHVEE